MLVIPELIPRPKTWFSPDDLLIGLQLWEWEGVQTQETFQKNSGGVTTNQGIFQACSTGRKWPAIAKAEAEPAFNALPQKQRHVEAVNRVERALVTQWQKLTPKKPRAGCLCFFPWTFGISGLESCLPSAGNGRVLG